MSRDVYAPSDDTELLIQALRKEESSLEGKRVADIGTGSGAVAEAMTSMGADLVVAIDISPLAARAAKGKLADVVRADLMSALRGPFDVVDGGRADEPPSTSRTRQRWSGFDVVAFNAPYLPSSAEERVEGWLDKAFHGGEGGVEVSEAFVRDLRRVLAPGGRSYLVVSSRADLDRLRATVREAGFHEEKVASARFFFEEIAVWKLL